MDPRVNDFILSFTSIVWEAFPFIVLGALVAGILEEVVPQQLIAKIVPKNKILAIALGGGLGLLFPMCECGIVPVMRRLLRKGLPLGTCVAYMLAGPIINVVVILSTIAAFDGHGLAWHMTLLRVGMGFMIAVTTGLIVDFYYQKHGNTLLTDTAQPGDKASPTLAEVHPAEARAGESAPLMVRLGNITQTAIHDFIDIMVFLILGAAIAASTRVWLFQDNSQIKDLSTGFAPLVILAMMGLAILMCLCSEADAFVAASFTTMHPSQKLAFLVLGPMFDFKLLLMFTRVFRRKLIVIIVVSVITQVFIYSIAVHYIWQALDIPFVNRAVQLPPEALSGPADAATPTKP